MLFNSFVFVALLAITFLLYYLPVLHRLQVYLLILASFVFYAFHAPWLLVLLVLSPLINILTSYYIAYGRESYRKRIAIFGVVMELLILGFFKYSGFLAKSFLDIDDPILKFLVSIPLPIGISFFTFEGISLVVDVYSEKYFDRKKYVSVNLWEHAKNIYCFISFFPHLVAGPIVKAHDLLPQIKQKYFREIDWAPAFKALVTGYFLKMVIADNLKEYTFWIEFPYFQNLSSITLVTLLFGYSFQIFADFAGYSLIAIGLARLFGYELMKNFNFPYIATSFSEFWQRWHISLSTYLKEYLYIPLGGNRKGNARTYVNLLITMILGGLWHGAAWSYAVWGLFHGLALAIERFFGTFIKLPGTRLVRFFQGCIVFILVSFAWLLFKLPDFNHVLGFLNSVRSNFYIDERIPFINYILIYSIPVILYHLLYLSCRKYGAQIRKLEFLAYGTMIFLIVANSGSAGEFIYFQF